MRNRPCLWVFWVVSVVLYVLVQAGVLQAQEEAPPPEGPAGIQVQRFAFRYGLEHPDLPPVEALGDIAVRLAQTDGVWHSVQAPAGQDVRLGQLPESSRFAADALVAATQAIVGWLNARGIYGVWAACSDLESSGEAIVDLRAPESTSVEIVVWASQVAEVRTLARGGRFPVAESINHQKHRRIRAGSPLQPGASPGDIGSLFRKEPLEEYLHGLSMHPGRRVEASIASAGAPGKVVLDYLVAEARPWQVFSQISNTGTATTGEWRGRLGFQHGQLTNHDDILNVDAVTTTDFDTNGAFVSYRFPLLRPDRLLLRVFGSYGDFAANDVTLFDLRFSGKNWLAGTELSNRTRLGRGWELASTLGASFTHYSIASRIGGATLGHGESDFLVPYVGPVILRDAGWWSLSGGVRVEHTIDGIANEDRDGGVPALGRSGVDASWTSLRWHLNGAVFLDPLFQGGMSKTDHLANELSLRVRGRSLLRGRRLIPQEEEPMGGAFTVRGYPASVLSADEFVTASLEYAFHVPYVRKPGEAGRLFGRPFRWRPPQRRQPPDWDLVLRAFADYGYRAVSPAEEQNGSAASDGVTPLIDENVSLAGAGVGIELAVRPICSIRCDVGMALKELRDRSREVGKQTLVASGDVQAHVVATFAW